MNLIGGSILLSISAIFVSKVLMNTLVTTNTTGWDASAASVWGVNQIAVSAGFVFVILNTFGLNF